MSVLNQLNEKHRSTCWLDRDALCDNEVIFAMHTIRLVNGNFGQQWKIMVEVREDTLPEETDELERLKWEEGKTCMMSLPSSDARDKIFNDLLEQGHLPLYNCYLDAIPQGRNVFYLVRQLEEDEELYQAPPRRVNSSSTKSSKVGRKSRIKHRDSALSPSTRNGAVANAEEFDPLMDGDDLP